MNTIRRATAILIVALGLATPVSAIDFMFRTTVDGEKIEGKPLAWSDYEMHLLARDGSLHSFNPQAAKESRKTGKNFVGLTMPEMRQALYRKFGDSLEITSTKHYIVVHPRGHGDYWAKRFEELYRSCLAYFRVRGFTPREPQFPLVAIVYRNEADYYAAAKANGTDLPSNMLGHYDHISNWVHLFDITAGKKDGGDWSQNADTIIHEATHQTAFNVGIHNRFADQPRWLVEGLATMFEARGVWNSQSFHSLNDRLNMGRLRYFKQRIADGKRQPGTFSQLVISDQMFRTDMTAAYAEAWAMALYLCETRPREFAKYLEITASRPDFGSYFAAQRLADFTECFGSDLKKLEANFLAWMKDIN